MKNGDMHIRDYYKQTYGLQDMDDIVHVVTFLSVLNIPEQALPVYQQEVERMIELLGAEMPVSAFTISEPVMKRVILFLLRCNSTCGNAPELSEAMMELFRKSEEMSKEYLHFMQNDPEIYNIMIKKHYDEQDPEAAQALWEEHKLQGDS